MESSNFKLSNESYRKVRPNELYNLAAQSHVGVSFQLQINHRC